MEPHELTLLRGAWPCARTFLLVGLESSSDQVNAEVEAAAGSIARVDWQGGGPDAAGVRQELQRRFAEAKAVVARIGAEVPAGLAEVLAEVGRGELALGDRTESLPEHARLLVVTDAMSVPEAQARAFGLQIHGMRVLNEARAKVARAEEELRRRQERARQSSREHGLV